MTTLQVQGNAALAASTSAARYATDVRDAIRGNVDYLLATRGEEPAARAWAAVAVIYEVATSRIARNAAQPIDLEAAADAFDWCLLRHHMCDLKAIHRELYPQPRGVPHA